LRYRLVAQVIVRRVAVDQSAKFWDKLAERYAQRPVADEAAYQKKLAVTRDYLRPDMQVLELGCGTGSTAISHAPHVKHIHAIDISAKMLSIARNKADVNQVNNVTFTQSTIADFGAFEQTFDAVLGLSILHLLDNKEEVVEKVYGMLKPGGIFASSTACLGDSMLRFLKCILPIGKFLGLMPMVKVFTAHELEHTLVNAGFQIEYRWNPPGSKSLFVVAAKPA
jgi:ubiquinone/menaquinone biosynthesis C-methylase UbiE